MEWLLYLNYKLLPIFLVLWCKSFIELRPVMNGDLY